MDKKSKKNIIIGLTCLFLATILLLGLTYAYYRSRVIGNDKEDPSISGISKLAEITYEDGISEMNMEGFIEPGFVASKTFYVENTGNQSVKYSIVLENVDNQFVRTEDWTWTLTENGIKIEEGTLSNETYQVISGSRTIAETKGTTNAYVFTINYENSPEDQSIDMGATLSFKVNIAEEQKVNVAWNNAEEGTLLYALKTNQPQGTETTIPGEDISSINEARIVETEDDYATSYVYRGNVTNNYVTFAKMCWRIVKVNGNGSIKLILEDQDNTCEEMSEMTSTIESYNPNKGNFDIGQAAYGYRIVDYVNVDGYNEKYYFADYLGFEGGMADAFQSYQTTLAKKIDSTIGDSPTIEKVTSTLSSKLEIGDWCNTDNIKYDSDFKTLLNDEQVINLMANNVREVINRGPNSVYSDSFVRLEQKTQKEPTLKCNGSRMNEFKDNTNMYVGALTADEIVYAGASMSNGEDKTYYLANDYIKINSQLVNRGDLESKLIVWAVFSLGISDWGGLYDADAGDLPAGVIFEHLFSSIGFTLRDEISLRPSVNLLSDITIFEGGEGTMDNPYVIN